MFELFPFSGTIVYDPLSPVTRPPSCLKSPALDSTEEECQYASPMRQLLHTDASQLQGFLDEKGSKSCLRHTVLESAPFLGSNGSESNSTISRSPSEHQELLSSKSRKRKGHRKSRNGCYNCKKRKIKCPENQPACHNCVKIKLECTYPPLHVIIAVEDPPLGMTSLRSTPTVFDSTDMRLFHHFLMNCYPHLPFGNDIVWIKDIPSFAHSYDYLMQAMLGLAASHLMMTSTSELTSPALSHRVQAIKGLNKALSNPPKSSEESDAILATTWVLAFQTSYIGDSVEEFLAMLRGCTLILGQDWRERFGTSFRKCNEGEQAEVIMHRLEALPLIDQDLVAEARESFEQLRELEMDETEKEVFQYLFDMTKLFSISSLKDTFSPALEHGST